MTARRPRPSVEAPEYWGKAKRELARNDAVLGDIIRSYPRIHLQSRGDPFQTLARSIVGQQISVKAAQSVWNRLLAATLGMTPEAILVLDRGALRGCGLSERKVDYLSDLARQFLEGSLRVRHWPRLEDEDVIAELITVRGIGRWTAEMFLIFNLLRPDVLPLDDLGLQRAVSLAYRKGRTITPGGLRRLAQAWRPWRSVATWYLWRSLDPLPVEY
jgi:DNA-3-methyladenine glycosylase II